MLMYVVVSGRVQGVGFRAAAKRYADQLKIKGFVRNCDEGSVEMCVEGSKEKIDEFLSLLKQEFSAHLSAQFLDSFLIL